MLHFAAIFQLDSLDYEKGFSGMKPTKTTLRNRMHIRNVNYVISMCVNGPNTQWHNFKIAFEVWLQKPKNSKKRKFFLYDTYFVYILSFSQFTQSNILKSSVNWDSKVLFHNISIT